MFFFGALLIALKISYAKKIIIIIINIIIIFVLTLAFHDFMGWTVSHEKLPSIYLLSYVLADFPFLSFRMFQIMLFHNFLGCPLGNLPLTLRVPQLLGQALSSNLASWPHHCKHSLPFFLDDQTIAVFYPVNTSPSTTILVHS